MSACRSRPTRAGVRHGPPPPSLEASSTGCAELRLSATRLASARERPSRSSRAIGAWSGTPTRRRSPSPLFAVESARGAMLRLADGRELIDGMSSWWSAIHGYRHPHIEAAVRAQLERLPHVMFGGLTHEPAVSLCERLVALAPGRARARLPVRLGLGLGRDRDQARAPVLARARAAAAQAAARAARRLSRRHVRRDGGVRSGHGHARAVRGRAPAALFAERPRCRFDEPCREERLSRARGAACARTATSSPR